MIDLQSSFSSKLIIEILTIKCSTKSLSNDLNRDIIQKIINIHCPKISQLDIQQISDQPNENKVKIILNNIFFKFHYDISLLNDISHLDIQNFQTINYLSLIVMYSYISLTINIEELCTLSNVKPLLNALLFVTKSQYSSILMNITASLISLFCLNDNEMNIYDLMPIIWDYMKFYQCYNLIIIVINHIFKDQNHPQFHHFMEELIQFIDNNFSDNAIIQIIQQFNGFCDNLSINSLNYLIKISNIVNKHILPYIIPLFPIVMNNINKTLSPIIIKNTDDNAEVKADCIKNSSLVIGEFEFSNVKTLPNGFDPSFSILFPTIIDLSTFFPQNLSQLFAQIATIIQSEDSFIDIFISSFFKTIDENNSTNQVDFNMRNFISFLFICNEINRNSIRTILIKSKHAIRFFQPKIFDFSVTIYNNFNNEKFTEFYKQINTFRSISLDYILYDDGISIENILLGKASNYPNFVAEIFFRLSKMASVFGHCIEKNPKLIKVIINLAISYQHLEISNETDIKQQIRNARIAIFITLAHLFSDYRMLTLFFNDSLFLNTFFIFLFEEPVRPFVLSVIKLFLLKNDIPLPSEFSSILYRVFNILNLNLSSHRHLLLINDIINTLNSGLTYRQKELIEFSEICRVLCQIMVKINISDTESELSKKIFKETISFLILMSPFYELSTLDTDSLISCVLSFNDKEFVDSLFGAFVSLLAGQPVSPNSTNIVICQPQIFTLLIQVFYSTKKLTQILNYINKVISFSPRNLEKCCEIGLDLFILKYLENAKITGEISDEECQAFLDIYSLLSLQHSSSQSVQSYISLLAPIDSVHVSKYHLKFIETINQMVIESSKMPRSTFPLNCRVMHVSTSPFSCRNIEKGFSVAFWIFIEPSLECNRIFSLKVGEKMKLGIAISNNSLLVYKRENHITKTKPIPEELTLHTWTFCAFTFTPSTQRTIVHYLLKKSAKDAKIMNIVPIENFRNPFNSSKASLKLGGFYQLSSLSAHNSLSSIDSAAPRSSSIDSGSSSFQNNINSFCRLGSFALFESMKVDKFNEITGINFQNNSTLPAKPIVYVDDYSEYSQTASNGFVDVLACQSGVNMLLPLFLQNDMKTFDDKPFHLSLQTILTLLDHVLDYSNEAQTNFFQSKGFNIIAQLLTDRWTPYFTMKTHMCLYQLLMGLSYEPLQQQLFDEVMTNFTFMQNLDPDLHYRIISKWPLQFNSFSNIAQNFSSFEDLIVILRLFYWINPVETQFIKYVELRSEKLKIEPIRQILFGLLFNYASESFQLSHFQCIVSHILSCSDLPQGSEMIDFLIKVFDGQPKSIQFNVECEDFTALLSYFIRYPNEKMRIQVLKLFFVAHRVKKISDDFFQLQVDSISFILPNHAMTRTLFDFLIESLENEPLLLNLCCFLAVYFKDASFLHHKKIDFHVSRFWAVLPLYLSINVDQSVTDFILESGRNDLCDIFIQYDIFFERSKRFESIFADKLLEVSQKSVNVNNIFELCQRIILFTPSPDEKTINPNCFSVFGNTQNSNSISDSVKNDTDSQFDSFVNFLKRDIKKPQLKFHVQFDDNENWAHLKLAVLCLSLFEKHFSQPFLPFDILLCSFLQTTNFDGVFDHLNYLNLSDKDLSECESVVFPLLNYHTMMESKKELIFSSTMPCSKNLFNPLLIQAKYDHLIKQMTPKIYLKKLQGYFTEMAKYKKHIVDNCSYMNQMNMSQYVVYSVKQLNQFLERQKFQNDSNIRSWRRLWSALTIERAPWHINSDDGTILSRDVCACFALAPVKMHKHLPFVLKEKNEEIKNSEESYEEGSEAAISPNCDERNSRFSKKRGIVFDSICFVLSIDEIDDQKRRKKANFELYRSTIKIKMIEGRHRGKVLTFPLSSLRYVFRRANIGIHFFTEFGYSYHIEFLNDQQNIDNNELQASIMRKIFQNLMKCQDRSIVLFQYTDSKPFFKLLPYYDQWKNGKISNYEYILMLNHCSGRSFNDISCYPIFPWILNNYSTDTNHLFDLENIRDFSYSNLSNPQNKKFLSKAAVLTYLNKIEPFKFLSTEFKFYQSKEKDENEEFRECFSMNDMLEYAKDHDFEFVPEFYSTPEIFTNSNSFLNNDQISIEKEKEFILPSWANSSPIEFVYNHRKILESESVTREIHEWFSNVFGKDSDNELFTNPHPPADVFNRERHPAFKYHIEIPLGVSNLVAGIISENDSPLVFIIKLLDEDGKLIQTTLNLRQSQFTNSKSHDNVKCSDYNNSSSESYISDHDDATFDSDAETSGKSSFSIYSNYKKGFHFSFPRINEMEESISSNNGSISARHIQNQHSPKKRKISECSSSINSYFSPDFNKILSFDGLKSISPLPQPDLIVMETPLIVGKAWNKFESSSKPLTSFVTSSESKFYVARGQFVTAIDLNAKKIHKVNVSGSTITTLASNMESTITENSPSGSTSTSSFTLTTSKLTKSQKTQKVTKRSSELSSAESRENLQLMTSPGFSSASSSSPFTKRTRAASLVDSLSTPSSSSHSLFGDTNSSLASSSSASEAPRIDLSDSAASLSDCSCSNAIRCLAADGIWMAVGRENASTSLVCNLRSVASIQSYRASVSACAVSQTFNVLACGTLDGALIIYTKDAGRIVKVIDIAKCCRAHKNKSQDGSAIKDENKNKNQNENKNGSGIKNENENENRSENENQDGNGIKNENENKNGRGIKNENENENRSENENQDGNGIKNENENENKNERGIKNENENENRSENENKDGNENKSGIEITSRNRSEAPRESIDELGSGHFKRADESSSKRRSFNVHSSSGGVTPKKIAITPTWGFIVVVCDEIDSGLLKHFVCVFTINGEFVRKVDFPIEIDFLRCWSSYSGFDYIVLASETGHVFVNEVFYMDNNHSMFNCRDRIVASHFSKDASTLVLATSGGKVLFFPIVF